MFVAGLSMCRAGRAELGLTAYRGRRGQMVACAFPELEAATMSSVCQVQIAASDLIGREQKGGWYSGDKPVRTSVVMSCLWPETGHCPAAMTIMMMMMVSYTTD